MCEPDRGSHPPERSVAVTPWSSGGGAGPGHQGSQHGDFAQGARASMAALIFARSLARPLGMSREILNIVTFATSFCSRNSAPLVSVVVADSPRRENQW